MNERGIQRKRDLTKSEGGGEREREQERERESEGGGDRDREIKKEMKNREKVETTLQSHCRK